MKRVRLKIGLPGTHWRERERANRKDEEKPKRVGKKRFSFATMLIFGWTPLLPLFTLKFDGTCPSMFPLISIQKFSPHLFFPSIDTKQKKKKNEILRTFFNVVFQFLFFFCWPLNFIFFPPEGGKYYPVGFSILKFSVDSIKCCMLRLLFLSQKYFCTYKYLSTLSFFLQPFILEFGESLLFLLINLRL